MALAETDTDPNTAYQTVSQLSQALEGSYRDLQSQVARLRGELAAARRERVRQLEERARLSARLGQIMEALPGGVIELDGERRVRAANPAAVELLGEDPTGRDWRVAGAALAGASARGGEATLPSGRRLCVSTRARAGGGEIVLLTDVTEAALLRQMVERHQRLATLGEMAARLAHDVRTPLAAALLYASRLGVDGVADEGRRDLAAKVVGRLRHLEGLVADMLAFARGGGGSLARCDVSALLESAAQSLASRIAGEARLTIATRAPGLAVRGNPEALVGAIVNLATNALDAAGPSGRVEIEAAAADGWAEIRVRDDGPGVPAALRERIFEPFYTTRSHGTGLGLAVVRSVGLAHGGSVDLEDTPSGASFRMRLPALGADA
ncbi:MAG: sensor histidine kinase [Pseudomonadota bacterium]